MIVDTAPPRLRSEIDPDHIATLSGERDTFSGAVSPDGRSFAYWEVSQRFEARVLRVVDVSAPTRPRILVTLPEPEMAAISTGGGVAWSNDGTGLLIGVSSREYVPGPPHQPNVYTALRQVDVATGAVREIMRRAPGLPFFPLAWDRARDLSVAVQWGGGGFVTSYVVVSGAASLPRAGLPKVTLHPLAFDASPDATQMLAWSFYSAEADGLYVWPLDDPGRHRTMRPPDGERVAAARWRNDRELVVSLTSGGDQRDGTRLEVWPLDGPRRVVLRMPHRLDTVRPDGTAALTSAGVVDLETGVLAAMPAYVGGLRAVASVILR